jgi:hypothetical protein
MSTNDDGFGTTAEAFEAADNVALNPDTSLSLGSVVARRYSRREMLAGSLGVTAMTHLFGAAALTSGASPASAQAVVPAATVAVGGASFDFREVAAGIDERHHVAEGYSAEVVVSWGDPIMAGAAPFDPTGLTGGEQARRFGYNNDYLAYFPVDGGRSRGLLCVNHEYCNPELMFAGIGGRPDRNDFAKITAAHVDIEMAAHGVSVLEITLTDGRWTPVLDSPFNRRITASTPMSVDGPAAGNDRLKTAEDPSGRLVLGTLNNCAGGQTPWGTYLTAEENFHGYFWTEQRGADGRRLRTGLGGDQKAAYERYGVPFGFYSWGRFHDRFNVDKTPNEPNRFGWIVEVDPFSPNAMPVKHTALGRFRHEGSEVVVNGDGRVVVYSGDDSAFEYVYRFVSKERYQPSDRRHNMRLLSEGTLSVARFEEGGDVVWLPLVFGEGPLTAANGFRSQADVVIEARRAADLLKATPMDRPEDVQPSPKTGKVYVLLTNNERRKASQIDGANPRAENLFGHIVEMTPPGGDHAAERYRWEMLIRCGDPAVAAVGALWNPVTSQDGWFAAPDNCAFDSLGRMWIATDQGANAVRRTGRADGLFAVETDGALRGASKMFFRAPVGAEVCGPCMTPDGETMFIAVQHPGTDGVRDWKPFGRDPTFEDPPTRWPDFKPDLPPRPSVLAIRKTGGGRIA